MNHFFSARSPLWQIITSLLFFPFLMLIAYGNEHDTQAFNSTDSIVMAASAAILLLTGVYFTMIARHNHSNPGNKISLFGLQPPEIKDEDEGMSMITSRATKRVYGYHSVAIPVLSICALYVPPSTYAILGGLMALSIGHYITYWIAIKPAFSSNENEE